jgi:O-acetyl-ADP-ribose deacetylase (regulator of RNase III)
MKMTVQKIDITTLEVDAIINAANSQGWLGGGVAGAIRRKGGHEIEAEAVRMGPTPVGKAVATTAGKLHCKKVIHAPTMEEPAMPTTKEKVTLATKAALNLAREMGFKRVAIPGLGTGVGGVPYDEAAEAIIDVVRSFPQDAFDEIILADINEDMIQAFNSALKS